jgi:peroxiredoxin Q/BCP
VRRFDALLDDFDRAGVDVLGASVDEPEYNAEFCDAEGLRYDLVSDPGGELAGELGILQDLSEHGHGLRARRVTYLVEPDGTILKLWVVGAGDAIDAHPDEVLELVLAL